MRISMVTKTKTASFEAKTKPKDEIIAQFLTAEFNALNHRATQYDQNIAGKSNFYLAVVTAVVGGIFVASTSDKINWFTKSIEPIACIVLAFLLVLGVITLSQILDLSASSKVCLRRAGRIRHWFLTYAPTIKDNLPFTVTDSRPPFLERNTLRGVEATLLLINASVVALLVGLLIVYLLQLQSVPLYVFVLSTICFLAAWVLQIRYVRKVMKDWERRESELGLVKIAAPKNHEHDNH
jgi:hypothetical protein